MRASAIDNAHRLVLIHARRATPYGNFAEPNLLSRLQARKADGPIVNGSETDVCVLATVLGAVDLGYRVILIREAICSFSDAGHDALMQLYHQRYTGQIEVADAATIAARWRNVSMTLEHLV